MKRRASQAARLQQMSELPPTLSMASLGHGPFRVDKNEPIELVLVDNSADIDVSWIAARPPCVVLVQDQRERPGQFAQRALERLDQLTRREGRVQRIRYIGAETEDVPMLHARLVISLALEARPVVPRRELVFELAPARRSKSGGPDQRAAN